MYRGHRYVKWGMKDARPMTKAVAQAEAEFQRSGNYYSVLVRPDGNGWSIYLGPRSKAKLAAWRKYIYS